MVKKLFNKYSIISTIRKISKNVIYLDRNPQIKM